jgi:hypothetical protein
MGDQDSHTGHNHNGSPHHTLIKPSMVDGPPDFTRQLLEDDTGEPLSLSRRSEGKGS